MEMVCVEASFKSRTSDFCQTRMLLSAAAAPAADSSMEIDGGAHRKEFNMKRKIWSLLSVCRSERNQPAISSNEEKPVRSLMESLETNTLSFWLLKG